jgi:signal transduction histidine kinase
VEDNGCGFNGAPPRNGADGFRNMRQRMKEIGGDCHIEAAPGKGTRVSFSFPLPVK